MNNSWDLGEPLGEEEMFEEEDIETLDDAEDEDDEFDDSTEVPDTSSYSVYRRKYNLLLERCNAIEQDNELLVSKVKEVKKLWKKSLRERRVIVDKLDSYNDNFRNVPIIFPLEDEASKKSKEKKLKKGLQGSDEGGSGVGRGRKPKGDKVAKDPNLPKRPQNPFFQFCKEKREEVAQEVFNSQGVNLTKKELTKLLANQWNSLDNGDKTIYNERFEAEKAGYNIKMEAYRRKKEERSEGFLNSLTSQNSLTKPSHVLSYNCDSYEDSFD